MKYICIFCSANDLADKYTTPAKQLARLLVKNGYGLVWGGSDTGLMKEIASTVQESGGKLIGVSIPRYKDVVRKNIDETIITKTLGERKATMLERSDVIVCLVGGVGTLDEVTEVIELKKQGHHHKPIIILNTENFYEGLKVQFQKMKDDGFIKQDIAELVSFADTPEAVFELL